MCDCWLFMSYGFSCATYSNFYRSVFHLGLVNIVADLNIWTSQSEWRPLRKVNNHMGYDRHSSISHLNLTSSYETFFFFLRLSRHPSLKHLPSTIKSNKINMSLFDFGFCHFVASLGLKWPFDAPLAKNGFTWFSRSKHTKSGL